MEYVESLTEIHLGVKKEEFTDIMEYYRKMGEVKESMCEEKNKLLDGLFSNTQPCLV